MSKTPKMSVNDLEIAEEEFEKYYTVFEGSSPEDVFHAKLLWKSLSLSPPQESRLESSDIHQRLKVAGSRRDSSAIFRAIPEQKGPPINSSQRLQRAQRQEEREKCASMAKQRGEIQDLLLKQREQRIQKEKASGPYKLKQGDTGCKSAGNHTAKHSQDSDIDEVKLLQ